MTGLIGFDGPPTQEVNFFSSCQDMPYIMIRHFKEKRLLKKLRFLVAYFSGKLPFYDSMFEQIVLVGVLI